MDINEDHLLELIYRDAFPDVARIIKKWGGDLSAAQDVFHDAVIIYLEKYRTGTLSIHSSSKAYIIGITKILWLKQNRDNNTVSLTSFEESLRIPEDFHPPQNEQASQLLHHLKATGKKCLQLLQAFYYDNLSMQKITEKFNYKTKHSATVQKYKCLEKLREQVKLSDIYEEVVA